MLRYKYQYEPPDETLARLYQYHYEPPDATLARLYQVYPRMRPWLGISSKVSNKSPRMRPRLGYNNPISITNIYGCTHQQQRDGFHIMVILPFLESFK